MAGVVALVAVLYAGSVHAVVGNSDGATVVLQGRAMSSGNALLHQWTLSLDSFWSVDALFYTVAVAVAGVHPALLFLVPAVIAALVVVTGAWMAGVGQGGASAVAGVVTVVALLGLPSYVMAFYFLQGPLHVGTTLWCLLAFAGLRRGRFGWGWVMAVVFLAAGVLGDFQTAAIGMAPAFVAGGIAMARTRAWRPGVATASAPVVAAGVAAAVRVVTEALGTYSVGSANPTASGSKLVANLGLVATWGSHLLGVGGGVFGYDGVPTALEMVHVVGLAGVVAGVALAGTNLVRGVIRGRGDIPDRAESRWAQSWRIDDLLVVALLADLAVFVTLTYSGDENFSRYLTAAVVFGAVLAGRAVARAVESVRSAPRRRVLAVLGVVVVAAFGSGFGLQLTGPEPQRPYAALGRFLEARRLDNGIGDYWSASITSVQTGDAVTVRPVIADGAGHLKRYGRQSTDSWYRAPFQFLVYDTALPWGGVDAISASTSFGSRYRVFVVGPYRVLVWHHPLVVPARPAAT